MAATTAIRRPAVPATAAPAVCDGVRGGDGGGDAAALSEAELEGEKTAVIVLMAISSELDAAGVGVALALALLVGTKPSAKAVESWAAVISNTTPGIVELLQIGATEVYEAPKPVSPELETSLGDRAGLMEGSVDVAALTVDVVLQARYSDPIPEDGWRITEEVELTEMVVVVIVDDIALLARWKVTSIDGLAMTVVSALRTDVEITNATELDAGSTVILSDVFDVGGGDQWETPAVVIEVCKGVV
jgi:hypothetical protein